MAKQTKSRLVDKPRFPFFVSFIGLLFFFLFFLTRGLTLPFVGFNAWNFNTYALIAHNYNQLGFRAVQFAPIISVSQKLPHLPEYYLHHPPFLYIIMGLAFRIFGESFWSARLPVLFASVLSFSLIILIGTRLHNRLFGLFSGLAFALMPASVVFGRMIGHESLVLFFILLFVYFVLLYENRRESRYLFGALLTVILGVLSDWPMLYFVFLSFPYFLLKKQKKEWSVIFVTALTTALLFFLYIFTILGSFQDVQQAFLNRSTGALLHLDFWPIRWISIINLRIFLYFTPVFVLFSLLSLVIAVKKKLYNDRCMLILVFLIFGTFHILLFPEGSFGHPYWIYYLSPFFAFSSGYVFYALWRRRYFAFLALICVFTIGFFLKIEDWKYKEMFGNLWRYNLMSKANASLLPYEPVIINTDGVVDPDLIAYAFKHPYIVSNRPLVATGGKPVQYFLYSCVQKCSDQTQDFFSLTSRYFSKKVTVKEGEMYIFYLKKPQMSTITTQSKKIKSSVGSVEKKESRLRHIYILLRRVLEAPQI